MTRATDLSEEPAPSTPTAPRPTDGPDGPEGAARIDDALGPHPGQPVPWPPRPDQRGLAAPYPPGGVDPDPEAGLREDRRYLRLLIAMVLLIVVGGFVISLIGLLLGFTGSAG